MYSFINSNPFIRVCPRFFDQVGHETMYASCGNKHFFTKSCHRQTYQNYEQSRQELGTFLGNKVRILKIKSTKFEMFEEVVHTFGKCDGDII